MESSIAERYTRFPSLDYGQDEISSLTSAEWKCDGFQLDIDTLILSWALVLGHLSGEESPVFQVDERVVKSHPPSWSVEEVSVETSFLENSSHTGIYTKNNQNDKCSLELQYDFSSGHGSMISRACVSSSYLDQVARQLEAAARDIYLQKLKIASIPSKLSIVNEAPMIYPGRQLLHDLVAKRDDEAHVAIEFFDGERSRHKLSYNLLHALSDRLASRLRAALRTSTCETKHGLIVPILLPQSLELYVAWLAILKAGAAACPLNLDAPPDRINFIVNDTDASVVVTSQDLVTKFDGTNRPIKIIIADDSETDPGDIEFCEPAPESLAYVMYTSGSTGLPKGVGISHRAAVQAMLAHDDVIPSFRRFLQFASPTFDVSVFEIFFPLFKGSTLVACERRLLLNDLVGIINELEIDAAELTPTVAGELLRYRKAVPSLKLLLTIGEMLTKHVVEEFGFSEEGDGMLYGMYGPTEATIHCTVAPKFKTTSRVGNIGHPLNSVSAFIIGQEAAAGGEPEILPMGHIGELAIGGPQVANCYLNRPEENQKAFVNSKQYGRLYRTGDKARLHPNGELECLGRISTGQVKLRGQRIELGEIEGVMSKGPGVRTAAVCVISGILVAFVSMDISRCTPEDLDALCKKWLPKYMVPGDIVCLDELPRLASGKVDRKVLQRDYELSKEVIPDEKAEFASEVEEKIARCVEDVLGASTTLSSSLVAAGLDSLKAIKLVTLLRSVGIKLDVLTILESDTIRKLSAAAQEIRFGDLRPKRSTEYWDSIVQAGVSSLESIGVVATPDTIVPCSPIQLAMVLESSQNPRNYVNWIELEFNRDITTAQIKEGFSAVSAQNDILRSGFIELDIPEHPYALAIWAELRPEQFVECESFSYEFGLDSQQNMLHPLRIQLKTDNGKSRALIHIHHSLYDGWSWELILQDLSGALRQESLVQRPQYRLFTDFQMHTISPEETEHALRYWQTYLEGVVPSPWPSFQDKTDVSDGLSVMRRQFGIDLEKLDLAVRNYRVSRQTIFQAALGYLLSAYNGTPDVVFGSVSSGRTYPIEDIENIIGPCLSTLPLRFNLQKLRTVRDIVTTVHNSNRRSLAYQFLPLRDIKKASGLDTNTPLFDTLFVWQDTINASLISADLITEVESADFLEYNLTIDIEIRENKLRAKAIFQESVLSSSQVELLLNQVEQLAQIILDNPELSLQDINSHMPASTLAIENSSFSSQDSTVDIVDGIEDVARTNPERIAVEILDLFEPDTGTESVQRLTYSGLDIRSNRLTNCLSSFGVVPGDLVVVYLEKSLDLYISILAIVKAGAGYVPITPQTPLNRVKYIIGESKPRLCVTSAHLATELNALDQTVVTVDGETFANYSSQRSVPQISPSSVAYAVFTSGTTGTPKGVLVSRFNLQSNLTILSELYPDTWGSRMLQACSHSFDVSVFEIFFSWNRGMTLCSARNDILFRDIERVIRSFDITHLSLTPTVAGLIDSKKVPSAKFLVTSGEAMTPKVLGNWADNGLWQGYGPCETTNICTVRPNLTATDPIHNIGKPFKNTSAFVAADGDGFVILPRGAVGEFCFGGDQVALGYLNMPEITAKKFINHPKYGRIYKSGDFGRMMPDGSLVFTGRQDDLIKLRGQRIELGEINSVLVNHDCVENCTTIVGDGESDGKRQLITFWVPTKAGAERISHSEDQPSVVEDLFDHVSRTLPSYMVPSFIIPVDQLPMTAVGKIDNKTLQAKFQQTDAQTLDRYSRGAQAGQDGEEFSAIEETIAEILVKVTEIPRADIGRHSSFYRLGLDSILAISLSRQLKHAGFGQVDVSTVMKNDSVARLAKAVQQASNASISEHPSPSFDGLFSSEFVGQIKEWAATGGMKVQKVLPCTPLQESMLSGTASGDQVSYYNHLTFEVNGDIQKLKAAWEIMVTRHDILRTLFRSTDDARFTFAQVVLESVGFPWRTAQCSHSDVPSIIDGSHSGILPEESSAGEIPYSFIEYQCTDTTKTYLHLSIHHALYDGEAMTQLLEDVEDNILGNQLSPAVPFDQYLQRMIQTDSETTDTFWSDYLSGFSPSPLFNSQPGFQAIKEFDVAVGQFDMPLADIAAACKESSVSLSNVLQAAWAKLLCYLSGLTDICFGDVMNCRNVPIDGIERVVGPCFNTLPVRTVIEQSTMNIDLMTSLQIHKADTFQYQLSSLRRLQSRFGQNGHRLFDTLVLLQSPPRPLNGNVWKQVGDTGNMDFPLVCEIIPDRESDKLNLYFHFDRSMLSPGQANAMMESYSKLIDHTLNFPASRALDFSVLSNDLASLFEPFAYKNTASKADEGGSTDGDEWTPEALKVRKLVSTLSNVNEKSIGLQTTIFQLGLDSINAIQVAGRLQKLGYKVTATDILESPSIGGIGTLLQASLPNSSSTSESQVFDFQSFESQHWEYVCQNLHAAEETIESIRPCTPLQTGMLALFVNSAGELYSNSLDLKSKAPLELPVLQQAWSTVMERNEILRTGFCHVKDDQFPFAMVTYRNSAVKLPWQVCTSDEEFSRLSQDVRYYSKGPESLHQPPWSIAIRSYQTHTIIRISALHALYDAHSLNLIISEVSDLYSGLGLQDPVSISQTLGFVLNKSKFAEEESRAFWSEMGKRIQNTKFPDMNPLHPDRKTTGVSSKLSSKTLEELQSGCRDLGITLQAAGEAAWSRILSSYAGEQDVTYGLVLSGRNMSEEAQGVVFPCLTTVPTHHLVDGSNRELSHRIMKSNAGLMKHQFAPLAKIQRLIKSDSAMFDTLFVFQKLSTGDEGYGLWDVDNEEAKTEHPVSIELIPFGERLKFSITYKHEVLPEAQASLLLEQLDHLLTDILDSPDSSCSDFAGVDPSVVCAVPRKDLKIPSPVKLVHEFVEVKAQESPDKIALEFASHRVNDRLVVEKWTYRELDNEGNKYANLLKAQGVEQGALVGVCFDKCPEAYFAILGILKVGCAYLAIDPGAPIARKQFIIEDSNTKLLFCTSDREAELTTLHGVTIIAVDMPGLFEGIPSNAPVLEKPIDPESTCYCLYTSGSTGTPKGCEITHDNTIQALLSFQRLFSGHWDESSRWLQFASFHFDVSVLEQYWSWSVGICLTSCPRDLLFEDLAGTIRELDITHIDLTPSLARLVHPDEVPSLCRGVFITGGEQLKQEILDAWGDHGVIYNGYGPTEVTIGCTMYPRVPPLGKPSNIGPQFDNVSSFVFKEGTNIPVIRGGIGELCVSGPLVGKGYLNRPELTAEKFKYIEKYGERIYRTGDLVRMMYDETFCFLGRIDDQVKLRGQRLEIDEINHVVKNSSDQIGEVVTMVLKYSAETRDQIVSFVHVENVDEKDTDFGVSFSDENAAAIGEARKACHLNLPGYMIPTHIIPVTKFPLSPNNKIERRKLGEAYKAMTLDELRKLSAQESEVAEELTEDMQAMIPIIAQMTNIDPIEISAWSNVFELGLDSISAITLAGRLREAGFTKAQPFHVMKFPTIFALSNALRVDLEGEAFVKRQRNAQQKIAAFSQMHTPSIAAQLGLSLDSIEAVTPCTALQEGMIYRCLEAEDRPYLSSFNFKLAENVDTGRLKASWRKAQGLIQVLRAKFALTDDGYAQAILNGDELPWFEIEVPSDDEVEHAAERFYNQWRLNLRDFTGVLWQVGVVTGPGCKWMCLNIFHGLYDGNSLPLLLEEVAKAYDGNTQSTLVPFTTLLPLGPLCSFPEAQGFWVKHLQNAPFDSLPAVHPAEGGQPTTARLSIDVEGIQALRRSLNVTEQSIYLACWLLALDQHFGFASTIGIVVSGRNINYEGSADNAIGPLFNTLPCRVSASDALLLSDLVRACHEYYVSIFPIQHTPLRDIMKWVRRSAESPLFDTLFVFQRESADNSALTESLWKPVASHAEADYPLAFEVQGKHDGSIELTLVAKGSILNMDEGTQLLSRFHDTIATLMRDPSTAIERSESIKPDHDNVQQQYLNGNHSTPMNGSLNRLGTFQWDETALKILQEITGLAGIDASNMTEDVSIFEIGLDSIDAIKLSSRLNRAGINLPVSKIMRSRTIRTMVASLNSEPKILNGSATSLRRSEEKLRSYLQSEGHDLSNIEHVLPATPLQEGMIAEMVASDYGNYFNHDVLELDEGMDVELLREAWFQVVKECPILRTSFVHVSSPTISYSYAQLVHDKSIQPSWTTANITNEQQIEALFEEARLEAIENSENTPLLSLKLLSGGKRKLLLISLPHAMYDGWSLSLIHQDVAAYYAGQSYGRPSYHHLLDDILSSAGPDGLKFWKGALAGVHPQKFPRQPSAEDGALNVYREETVMETVGFDVTSFCKAHGVTAQALGLLCWTIVLANYFGQLDLVFGTVMLGRDTEEASNVPFPTMNTVAMRFVLHGTLSEMLKYVQRNMGNIMDHQHFPLRKAKSLAEIGNQELFDTLFIYQRGPDGENSAKPIYTSISGSSHVEYPVCAEMELTDNFTVWRVACKNTVMGKADVDSLMGQISEVFNHIIKTPHEETLALVDIKDALPPLTTHPSLDTKLERGNTNGLPNDSWSPVEERIRSILSSVSGVPVEDITKQTTIFHLGIDSISAIKVSSLLRKQKILLSVSDMLRSSSIQNMAKFTRSPRPTNGHNGQNGQNGDRKAWLGIAESSELLGVLARHGIDRQMVEGILPATSGQIYMLETWKHSSGKLFYPHFFYRVKGSISHSQLEDGWSHLITILPILRTTFVATGNPSVPYVQAVLKNVSSPIIWRSDLRSKASRRHVSHGESPTFMNLYASQTTSETILMLHIHHALYDAVVLRQIITLLEILCAGPVPPLNLHVNIADFISFNQNNSLPQTRKAFWTDYLGTEGSGINKTIRPSAYRGSIGNYHPSLIQDVGFLQKVSRKHGVSPQSLFLAVYSKIYGRLHSSSEAVVIGIYLANRSHALNHLPDLVAPTLNIVPLLVKNPGGQPILKLAMGIQNDLQEIGHVQNSSVSLVEIAEWTGARVGTTVNFVMPPSPSEDFASASARELELVPIEEEEIKNGGQVNGGPTEVGHEKQNGVHSEEIPRVFGENGAECLGDVFKPSVDVEVAFRNGGLDVGIWAPEDKLSYQCTQTMLEELRQELSCLEEGL